MLTTVVGVVRDGKLDLLEQVSLPEGAKVLVTLLPDDSDSFLLMQSSEESFAAIWDNPEDDAHGELLKG